MLVADLFHPLDIFAVATAWPDRLAAHARQYKPSASRDTGYGAVTYCQWAWVELNHRPHAYQVGFGRPLASTVGHLTAKAVLERQGVGTTLAPTCAVQTPNGVDSVPCLR